MSRLLPHDAPGGCEQRRNRAGRQRALAGAAGGPAQRAEPVCLNPLVVAAEPVVHQRRHARDAQRGHARRRLRAPSMAALVEEGTRPETHQVAVGKVDGPAAAQRDEPIQNEFESSGHDASPAALLRDESAARSAPTASARNALETRAHSRCPRRAGAETSYRMAVAMLRFLTAGESHGRTLVVIVDGVPGRTAARCRRR